MIRICSNVIGYFSNTVALHLHITNIDTTPAIAYLQSSYEKHELRTNHMSY